MKEDSLFYPLVWKFKRKYADIPANKRDKIIAFVENEKLSWNAIYNEINNKTEKACKAIEFLMKLEVI